MNGTNQDRLIISCEYGSHSIFELHEAASELCDIIWLVDLGSPEMAQMARLMKRMGTVIDSAGHSRQGILAALREAGPTGALSLNDSSTPLLADMAAELGLAFHSPVVAERLSDKLMQRAALSAGGVPTPAWVEVQTDTDEFDIEAFVHQVGFPAVLKPRKGTGSRNTYKVNDRTELIHYLSTPGLAEEEPGGMIFEQFLPETDVPVSRFDPFVSVESFISNGEVRHLAIMGRPPFAEPFRETGLLMPSDISPENARAAETAAAEAIRALGVEHGFLHSEIKFTPEGPFIVEVNGRIGGGVPLMARLAGADVSILRLAMELALGQPGDVELPITFSKIAWQRTMPPPISASRIDAVTGLEELRNLPGVDQITINHTAGEQVDWRHGLRDYVFQVFGSCDNYDEVEMMLATVDRSVEITYGGPSDT